MIHLITYTDERMAESADNLLLSAAKNGVDQTVLTTPGDIPFYFRFMAAPTIHESKGAGLYIWKPFIIWDYIRSAPLGDIVIYADAGQTIVDSVKPVIDAMDQDIMMFSNGWNHMDWCKMDVAQSILGYAPEAKQVQASLIFFRVTEQTIKFVKEWMLWCLMPGFCDNSPSQLPNIATFQETRWDQSVLTCLQLKYGYNLHWFPTLTNYHNKAYHPNDNYPAISDHHRKRNRGATNGTDSEW